MDSVITIAEAAKELGCDKSNLLKKLKRGGFRIGKTYGDESARGQQVAVIRMADFEELKRMRKDVRW